MDSYQKLSQTVQNHMSSLISKNKEVAFEIGTIMTDYGLYIERFNEIIPKGDYFVDERLAIDYKAYTEVTTSSADNHSHTVRIPLIEGIRKLTGGDRVLVCWIGDDPVVMSVIISSKNI